MFGWCLINYVLCISNTCIHCTLFPWSNLLPPGFICQCFLMRQDDWVSTYLVFIFYQVCTKKNVMKWYSIPNCLKIPCCIVIPMIGYEVVWDIMGYSGPKYLKIFCCNVSSVLYDDSPSLSFWSLAFYVISSHGDGLTCIGRSLCMLMIQSERMSLDQACPSVMSMGWGLSSLSFLSFGYVLHLVIANICIGFGVVQICLFGSFVS